MKALQWDFSLKSVFWCTVVEALLCVCPGAFLPEVCFYENGLVENLQLVVLALGGWFCLKSGHHRSLFCVVGLVVLMLMLREVNCGRTLFFAKPGEVNAFYKWGEIPYGWVVRLMYGVFIAGVSACFLCRRLYREVGVVLRSSGVPVWNAVFLLLSGCVAVCGERVLHSLPVEELSELVFYTSLTGMIYLYSRASCCGKSRGGEACVLSNASA